jgi:DNA-binding transcriptional MerR regulator
MKATEMLSQIKAMLGAKLNLAQATLEDGTTVIEAETMEAGQPIFIVSDDERIALPVGEYTTSEGQIIVVAEEGVIAEIKDALEDEAKEEEPKEEQLEEEVSVEVPEGAVEEVSTIIESVVEVIAPIIEEVKEQVEELKRKMSEMEDKKEKMSSQKPARKPMKHNPNVKKSEPTNLYGQNYNFNTTKDRVFNRIFKK